MEIIIVWSWFSFFMGIGATVLAVLLLAMFGAYKQWKKQKEQADSAYEARAFAAWGGRDNSGKF